jgi:endonuclease/exonuclease/phosphatase family metal-dependent hydrolase
MGGHGGDSPEEATVFYLASGPSAMVGRPEEGPEVVDVAVTALTHLGIALDPVWDLDGEVVGIDPVPPQTPDTLRILAYNTHHGEGLDGALDLERIARLISTLDPDVVALQEVDREVERTGEVDQIGEYGTLTGMTPLFGDFMDYQGGQYGMGILSRLPVVDWENLRLPAGAEPRSTLSARVRIQRSGREVVVAGIHFYRTEEERMAQARRLREHLTGETAPVILAGDFNSTPGSPVMEVLGEEWMVPDKGPSPFTFPADAPAREIDFILLRPEGAFRVLEHRVIDETVASDHRPVFMVVEIR